MDYYQRILCGLFVAFSLTVLRSYSEVFELCDNINRTLVRSGVIINSHPNRTDMVIKCECRILPRLETRNSENGLKIKPSKVELTTTSQPNLEGVSICPHFIERAQNCTESYGYIRHSNPAHKVSLTGSDLRFTEVAISYYWKDTAVKSPHRGTVKIEFQADYDLYVTCRGNVSHPAEVLSTYRVTDKAESHTSTPPGVSSTTHNTAGVAGSPSSARKEFPVLELALAIIIPTTLILLLTIIAIVICCKKKSRRKVVDHDAHSQNFYVNDIELSDPALQNLPSLTRLGMSVYYNQSAHSLKLHSDKGSELQSNLSEDNNSLYSKPTPPHVDPNKYLPYNMEFGGSFNSMYEDSESEYTWNNIDNIYNEIRNGKKPEKNKNQRSLEELYAKPVKNGKLNNEPTGFKFYDRKTIHGNLFKSSYEEI